MGLMEDTRKLIPGWANSVHARGLSGALVSMGHGALYVLGLMLPRRGRISAFLAAWGAAFGVAAAVTYTYPDTGRQWVTFGSVALSVGLVARRCEPQLRWSSRGLWIQLGALVISVPLAVGFSLVALPATQLALVVAACLLVLWFLFSGDSVDEATEVRRGANSHVNRDGRPKVGYRSEVDAWKAAGTFEADTGERMSAYMCASCTDWHIGHARA